MTMKRAFISFDFDHDEELRDALVGQAKLPQSPFGIADWSVKESLEGNWKAKVRDRIRRTDLTIVICGSIPTRHEGWRQNSPLPGKKASPTSCRGARPNKRCTKPAMARKSDKIHKWTWDNLKLLVGGAR